MTVAPLSAMPLDTPLWSRGTHAGTADVPDPSV